MEIKWYGWKPDIPDIRDFMLARLTLDSAEATNLPESIDLSHAGQMPPVFDQGNLGSCTANAISSAIQFMQRKTKPEWDFSPSRLFIYYNERAMEGTINVDSGAYIRDGIKSVNAIGVCREDLWPYVIEKFKNKPPLKAYRNAQLHKALTYHRVPRDLNTMKSTLAKGVPFVFGFAVYEKFEGEEVARTGKVEMPSPGEKMLGGHAVLAVGYNNATQEFIVRNSWGSDWGLNGNFTMPYSYLTGHGLADDFWAITSITS